MILIDTHAHIYDPQFDADRETMLHQTETQQISQIWMPNCARETVSGMMALAEQYPERCLPMMGLHPAYVTDTVEDELAAVRGQLDRNAFMGVGEIGLDFFWDMTYVEQQFMAFETQLRWAAEQRLPVSMHTRSGHDRNAFAEAADLIEGLWSGTPALPRLTGIFHCFVGTLDEAKRAVDMGFKLGIGGVSTFKNGGLDTVLPHVDLAHLVLENRRALSRTRSAPGQTQRTRLPTARCTAHRRPQAGQHRRCCPAHHRQRAVVTATAVRQFIAGVALSNAGGNPRRIGINRGFPPALLPLFINKLNAP